MARITRRQFTALSIAGAAGMVWGCAPTAPQTAPAPTSAPAGAAKPAESTGPATGKPEVKREGVIVANIEDTYGHAAGMEAVAKEYQKLYPKVEIRVDPKPIEGYLDWAKAQIVGGTNASLMRDCSCPDLVAAGKFVDFAPYFEQINPYTEKKWSTMFKPGTIRADDATGQVIQFNMFSVYVLWFYNRTLWEKVGLKDTPKTWTDLIKVFQTFKDAGILPTPMAGDVDGWRRMGISWLSRITADAYARESINVVRAQPGDWNYNEKSDGAWKFDPKDPYNDAFGKVTRSPARMIQAFRDGKLKVDNPGYRDLWKHLKEFLQFVQPGYLGVNRETARQLFLTGKAGVWMDASWFFSQFEKFMGDASLGLNRFDYGTFNLVDIDGSPLVQAPTRTIDNSAGYWVLPKKDKAQNDLEVDFLMFMSSPKMAGLLVETTLKDPKGDLIGPPMIEGVELSEVWQKRFSVIGGRGQAENGAPGIHGIDPESQRAWVDLAQQYAADKLNEDQFFQQFQDLIVQSVPRVAKAQGYDLDNPGKKPTPPQ